MIPLTLEEICQTVSGQPLAPFPQTNRQIFQVTINSKQVPQGSLFIAIRGERFDGHSFLADVANAGAAAAMVEKRAGNS